MVCREVRNYFNKNNSESGAISPPADFLKLCDEIEAYLTSAAGKYSPYVGETVVGLHSWSKATKPNGTPVTWQGVFSSRLNNFRKMTYKG